MNFEMGLVSSSQMVDLVFLYFIFIFIFLLFYSLIFLFLEHRVRVSDSHESQDTENKVEGSRTNDIIQHRHHMLASCTWLFRVGCTVASTDHW